MFKLPNLPPEAIQASKKRVTVAIHLFFGFQCLLLGGILLMLLLGTAEPGDGEGSLSKTQACAVMLGVILLSIVQWKLFLLVINWIAARQIALIEDKDHFLTRLINRLAGKKSERVRAGDNTGEDNSDSISPKA